MVMQDPPGHTQFRRLVSRGFTPRQVTPLEPSVREFVRERLTRLREAGGGDIVAELFKPLPSMVVAHYLGVPEEDRPRFDAWTDAIVAAGSADPAAAVSGAADATAELAGYFAELVERRRREPGDDTVSHLVRAGIAAEGDTAGLVAILGFAFTMVTGGNDTSTGLLGGAAQLLTERRDQRAVLLRDLSLLPDAVEELLRLTSPVQGLARTTTRDVEVEGVEIPRGRKVLLLYGSANRDPRQFGADADELDVHRRPRTIMTFSHGAHHCLGAAAARLQARVALEELLTGCPDFEVDVDGHPLGRRRLRPPADDGPVRGGRVMSGSLAAARAEAAEQHLLDVAGELFAEHGLGGSGMAEVAEAAGCSRATLYRYFESRHALQLAYVEREARRIGKVVAGGHRIGRRPGRAHRHRRRDRSQGRARQPHPASVFSSDTRLAGDLASSSLMIQLVSSTFLGDVIEGPPARVARAAEWLVRVMVSLLANPGRTPAAERTLVRDFVVPGLLTECSWSARDSGMSTIADDDPRPDPDELLTTTRTVRKRLDLTSRCRSSWSASAWRSRCRRRRGPTGRAGSGSW